ncbi:SURF1 family protein [Pistricoccus aurantiacus]|uniref:SURF1 family protein n=1 Tax=Pistricoccus aurantiacus TaxID=1883414 RepID=UPI0036351BCB
MMVKRHFFWWLGWCLLILLGTGLGSWQWQRAVNKQAYLMQLESAPSLDTPKRLPVQGAEILLRGRYLANGTLWLDNRVHDGRLGVAALTPFRSHDGRLWLIERGFVATGPVREDPMIETPSRQVRIRGRWQSAESAPWVYDDQRVGDRLQRIDLAAWSTLGDFAFAGWIHLEKGPGRLIPWWKPNVMPPSRHRAYAFQWWGLALAALIVMLAGVRRMRREPAGSSPRSRL